MKYRTFVVAAVLSSSLVFAQMIPGGGGPGGPGGRGPGGPGGPHGMMRGGKMVAGAPYSATFTNTMVKTLADGNTIQRTTSGTVARDSQGRTYSQETITGLFGQTGTKTFTFISDPVAGYVYTLNSENKTAMRRALRTASSTTGSTDSTSDTRHAASGAVTADLGSQVVNGVTAQGKTVMHTVPAGQMGNEKPIVSTTETWYSPELQVVISSKRTNPAEGVSTYALTNIQRTEPASAMFAVPSDYTVKDAPSFGRHQ